MKRFLRTRVLSALLAVVMVVTMLPIPSLAASAPGTPFTDVKNGDWFADAVAEMYDGGYMSGTSATQFSPSATTDWALAVTILGQIYGVDTEAWAGKAKDSVPAGYSWAEPYIAWAVESGITKDIIGGAFDPAGIITRQEFAALLRNYLSVTGGYAMPSDPTALDGFTDVDQEDVSFKPALEWAVTAGIYRGKGGGALDPLGSTTRAEIAQVISNFLAYRDDPNVLPAPGATVEADPWSPTGYTVTFVFDPAAADELEGEKVEDFSAVSVRASLTFADPTKELSSKTNVQTAREYQTGMFGYSGTRSYPMTYNETAKVYTTSFPISSGVVTYSYRIEYKEEGKAYKDIDDPANPTHVFDDPNYDVSGSWQNNDNRVKSVVLGHYDPVKQAGTPNMDYVLPAPAEKQGKLEYVLYDACYVVSEEQVEQQQTLGVYVPAGYDPDRAEPYKTVYVSHGSYGNATDWFGIGQINSIMDNLGLGYVLVTVDNDGKYGAHWSVDNLVERVVPYIEANYNVSKEPADRAYCGLSQGGKMAAWVWLEQADQFAYIGSFSTTDQARMLDESDNWPTDTVYYMTAGNLEDNGFKEFFGDTELAALDNVIDGGRVSGRHDWFTWIQSFYKFITEVCWVTPGAVVEADPKSPSGYTVTFTFDPALAGEDVKDIASVSVKGPFNYADPNEELDPQTNRHLATEYKAGMFAYSVNRSYAMTYDEAAKVYTVSFPITSGAFLYSFVIKYADGVTEDRQIADPTNPSSVFIDPYYYVGKSWTRNANLNASVVLGHYDEVKQAGSPNMDYILPAPAEKQGTLEYVVYDACFVKNDVTTDLPLTMGIYLPAGYDPDRAEPYKTVYVSHGSFGNDTDWFGVGHIDNMMDNLGLDYVVVTLDNDGVYGSNWGVKNLMERAIPYMEANYNVSKKPADRAYCGLSQGGKMASWVYLEQGDQFGYIGSFSTCDVGRLPAESDSWSDTVYYIAGGSMETNSYDQYFLGSDFAEWDSTIDGGYLPGAHDWYTWVQAFHDFVTEVCWAD